MNLPSIEIERKAAENARKLLAQAVRNEPQITADLQEIASEVSAEIVGLEHKFKSKESLTKKLHSESIKSAKGLLNVGYTFEEAIEKSIERQTVRNNDALRYTFVLPFENYIFGFKKSLQKLKQKGYKIPENKIWNAWKNIGTVFDKGYRGINITAVSSQQQKFELQFHTRASYELKTEAHYLYKESKQSQTSFDRKIEIAEIIIESAQQVKVPKGVKKL